jgi:hypothetical protein
MSIRSDVLLWAQRIVARAKDTPSHVLLDVGIDVSVEDAQAAFHKIARTSHPDLHRSSLTPEELELVTTAYARVAGAYQDFRSKRASTTRMRPLKDDPPPPRKTPSSDRIPALRTPTGRTPSGTSEGRPQGKTPEGMTPVSRSPTGTSEGRPQGKTPDGTPPIPRSATLPGVGAGSPSPSPGAPGPMNSKALIYYRKAEMCLRQGDLKTACLNMKMAIAGDPQSTFLRNALAEIESELAKK